MSTPGVAIRWLDPGDDAALRVAWEVQERAHRADRHYAITPAWPAYRVSVDEPTVYFRRSVLVASSSGDIVGTAAVGFADADNQHLADLEVAVLPEHRRRGIGSGLYDAAVARIREEGRGTVLTEVHEPVAGPLGATDFARHLGFEQVHLEEHLVLDLPVSDEHVRSLRERTGHLAQDYEVLTWRDRCPEEHLAAYCAMLTRMMRDVPMGEVDYRPVAVDPDRVRADEAQHSQAQDRVVAAVRSRRTHEFAGYSVVDAPHGGSEVVQDDTLVMPEHRGRRLGLLLKLSTLLVVRHEHPHRTALHTWTSPANTPMRRTNTDFGYRAVELLHEMQQRLV